MVDVKGVSNIFCYKYLSKLLKKLVFFNDEFNKTFCLNETRDWEGRFCDTIENLN